MEPGRLAAALGPLWTPLRKLAASRPDLHVAGGAVRDLYLNRPVKDVDIAVGTSDALKTGKVFADAVHGALVPLGDGKLIRVVVGDTTVDFTPLRARTLDADLRARDFTINAMAMPLSGDGAGEVLDPTDGRRDLKARRLRACSDRSFRDDPIRLWRAHRLAVGLGFTIEPTTARWLKRDAKLVAKSGGERVRDELFKLLAAPGAARALGAALQSGVLLGSLPELAPMQAVKLKGLKPIDVLAHTLEAIGHVDRLMATLAKDYPDDHTEMAAHFSVEPVPGRPRRALLGLALLLHDIAKPETASRNDKGDVHFFQHESIGAKRAAALLHKRLKCAADEVAIVARLVIMHLRPGYLAAQPRTSDKAAYRLLRDAGEDLFELCLHAQADRLATHHGRAVTGPRQRAVIRQVLSLRRAMRTRQPAIRLLTGHDLMKAFKLKPGPAIGELLRAVDEGVALGRIRTRSEALLAARKVLDRPQKRVL
jgi:tRNA nucleotidyltransferase/poly(A) polymerase